jgi:propionyl-CoA:succinyl-CoA transferase
MPANNTYVTLTAEEAASLIPNGAMVAVSGFTPAGAPKAVPRALAAVRLRSPTVGDTTDTAFR